MLTYETILAELTAILKTEEPGERITRTFGLKSLVEAAVRENAGSTKCRSRYQAAKKYIAETVKKYPERTQIHGAWIEDGKQMLSNAYSVIRLSDYIPGLVSASGMEMRRYFDGMIHRDDRSKTYAITELVSLGKVAAAEARATKALYPPSRILISGPGQAGYDVYTLALMAQILGGKEVTFNPSDAARGFGYMSGDYGDAVICAYGGGGA